MSIASGPWALGWCFIGQILGTVSCRIQDGRGPRHRLSGPDFHRAGTRSARRPRGGIAVVLPSLGLAVVHGSRWLPVQRGTTGTWDGRVQEVDRVTEVERAFQQPFQRYDHFLHSGRRRGASWRAESHLIKDGEPWGIEALEGGGGGVAIPPGPLPATRWERALRATP